MNRNEFLTDLYRRYPKFFTTKEFFNEWVVAYKMILPETSEYTELYRRMILNFSDMFKPPSPAELNKIRNELLMENRQQLTTYKPFDDGVEPPPEWTKLKQKFGI